MLSGSKAIRRYSLQTRNFGPRAGSNDEVSETLGSIARLPDHGSEVARQDVIVLAVIRDRDDASPAIHDTIEDAMAFGLTDLHEPVIPEDAEKVAILQAAAGRRNPAR
jgi:hypothetical protein